ncbi:hypothetical protein DRO97_08980 [Archaeoglobales archaeon]|nr:MAG: hypothetical protein DRO97_08980 [Archaeoglobales archaeon]
MNKIKEKIIEVALKTYTSKPPHEVTIEEIAKKVGVSKSLVLYYFENKGNLEKEVANYTFKQILKEWTEKINSVKDLIDLSVKNFKELPNLLRFWAYISGKALYYEKYEFFRDLFEDTMEIIIPLFEREEITKPKKTAIALMAMFDGLALYSLFYDIGDIEDYRKIAMEFVECRRLKK